MIGHLGVEPGPGREYSNSGEKAQQGCSVPMSKWPCHSGSTSPEWASLSSVTLRQGLGHDDVHHTPPSWRSGKEHVTTAQSVLSTMAHGLQGFRHLIPGTGKDRAGEGYPF